MDTVNSADGTSIAFERAGNGPALIFVVGAFNDRQTAAPLAAALAAHYTVITYDRRGRGDSGDTKPYAVAREIEVLDALIAAAGGTAIVFGYSSGAILAMRAAAAGSKITKLALYEPPFNVDGDVDPRRAELGARLDELVAQGRRGDAVTLFQTDFIGMPAEVSAQIRQAPFWAALEAMANTLSHEVAIVGDGSLTPELTDAVTVPTLVMCGSETSPGLLKGGQATAERVPAGTYRELAGQTHDLNAEVMAPVITEFLR